MVLAYEYFARSTTALKCGSLVARYFASVFNKGVPMPSELVKPNGLSVIATARAVTPYRRAPPTE